MRIEVVGVSLRYPHRAGSAKVILESVSLAIPAGGFVALTGPSGAGKTTLLSLLGALEVPSAGQVLFDGRDAARFTDAERARLRRRIGFVFQDSRLIPALPVWENVTCGLIPRGITRSERYERARELLDSLEMQDFLDRLPHELSGGEQQRVALARALAADAEVLLLDEPTASLDREGAERVTAVLQTVHEQGKTVVIASHDPVLLRLAKDVWALAGGRLLDS